MYRVINLLIFVCFTNLLVAQKVRVEKVSQEFERFRNTTDFDYVHDDFDSSKIQWVADLTVKFDTVIPGMLGECFLELKEKSNRFGANAFKVNNNDIFIYGNEKYISISCFFIRQENRAENMALFNENSIYLFGFLAYHTEIEGYEVTLNEEEMIIGELSFRKYEYEDKEDVNLLLGSKSRGAYESVKIEEGMKPKFYYFNMVKGSFKNAWIAEYDLFYGIYLSKILMKAS
ncbi:MAG: hypothetical protein ABJG68_10065 [Crocinitomicaceae bacterium]